MKKYLFYISFAAGLLSLAACEKVVHVDLPNGNPLPYIDAWITDRPGVQTVRFLQAANYLDNAQPTPIAGALVTLTDVTAAQAYPFTYANGAYTYDGGPTGIGVVNHVYKLSIQYSGQQFEATDTMKRVTVIDSIPYEYKKAASDHKEGYFAKLYAKDQPGATDYYWIRTYKNGTLNYHLHDMVTVDAGFRENITDGFLFIPPFRDGITADDHPYQKADVVKVVLRSLSRGSHDFWDRTFQQLENQGLFARVLENVPHNMQNTTPGGTAAIYGWFGMTAETEQSRTMQ